MKYLNIILLVLLINITNIYASILVLEYKAEGQGTWHGEEVAAVACEVPSTSCQTKYTDSFSYKNISDDIIKAIDNSSIINMSFSVFKPPYPDYAPMREDNSYEEDLKKYHKALISFEEDKESLENMLLSNPYKLFSIASGNGVFVRFMSTPGVAMIQKYAIYPSFFNFPNTIKVSALNEAFIDINNLKNHKIADYSNYGLEKVDIAAPVPMNTKGEKQRGTSFAAPFISKMANVVKTKIPHFDAIKIKELLMKSVYVPNLKKALWASTDLLINKEKSITHLAQYHPQRIERLKFQEQLGNVMLVKSGGFIVPQVMKECIQIILDTNRTIEESCLLAHKNILKSSPNNLELLKSLWKIRKF
jgi:hypothetical protein